MSKMRRNARRRCIFIMNYLLFNLFGLAEQVFHLIADVTETTSRADAAGLGAFLLILAVLFFI